MGRFNALKQEGVYGRFQAQQHARQQQLCACVLCVRVCTGGGEQARRGGLCCQVYMVPQGPPPPAKQVVFLGDLQTENDDTNFSR